MEASKGDTDIKQKILKELGKCVKVIYARSSTASDKSIPLTIDCQLISSLDRTLQHGLTNSTHGYWPLVSGCSHGQTLKTVEMWVGTEVCGRSKGQVWLLVTLAEGSLESYLQCIIADFKSIDQAYSPSAIMRDSAAASLFCSIVRGLESINFKITECLRFNEEIKLEGGCKFALSLPLDDLLTSAPTTSTMTSSMTSSLASPEDSGFTQLDSETDTGSCSEMILERDSDSARLYSYQGHTESMTTSDIVNGNTSCVMDSKLDSDDIVYKRPKKSKTKAYSSKQSKRVSFHEHISELSDKDNDEDKASALECIQGSSIPNTAKQILDSFKKASPSLSLAISGVSSFNQELEGVEIGKDSSVLCRNSLVLSHSPLRSSYSVNAQQHLKQNETGQRVETIKTLTSVTHHPEKSTKMCEERGIPEGQEDPPLKCRQHLGGAKCSMFEFSSDKCDTLSERRPHSPNPSCCSLRPQLSSPYMKLSQTSPAPPGLLGQSSILNQTLSKACIVNRFLKSVTQRKLSSSRLTAALSAMEKKMANLSKISLYIPGMKPDLELSEEILLELKEETAMFRKSSSVLGIECTEYPQKEISVSANFAHILSSRAESVFKIANFQSFSDSNGTRSLLHAVVTNQALYICNKLLEKQTDVHLSQISSIVVGPSSQWVMLNCRDRLSVTLIALDTDCVALLIGSIEFMLRKNQQSSSTFPFIHHISFEEFSLLSPQVSILKGEKVHHYSVVHAVENSLSPTIACVSSAKEAHFMYRFKPGFGSLVWKPGFFVLKMGVLHIFSDEAKAAPFFTLNVRGVSASIVNTASRPHTVEVGPLQIAAPDNFVACDWLKALEMASVSDKVAAVKSSQTLKNGSLILTDCQLLLLPCLGTCWEPRSLEPLLSGYLSDVTSLFIGGNGSCWCVVELSCREVRESGGDYIVLFNTHGDLLRFIEKIWELNSEIQKATYTLSKEEQLYYQCEKAASIV